MNKMDELITKYLSGVATENQKKELKEWVSQSKENQRYFMFSKNIYNTTNLPFDPAEIDEQKALRSSLRKMSVKRTMRIVSRVAAVLFLTLMSAAVITLLIDDKDLNSKRELALAKKDNSAVLTLATGETVMLNKNMKQKIKADEGVTIDMEDGAIRYRANNQDNTQQKYNEIYVPTSGDFHLVLDDGTKVWINADTKLRYPTNFTGDERVIFLEGEAYFEVTKDEKRPFKVISPRHEVMVLGTSFDVCTYKEDENALITLSQGKVEISSTQTGEKTILSPGEQAVINNSSGQLSTRAVDPSLYCGWKDGRLIFISNTLSEILGKLNKYYDVDVVWKDESLKKLRFTGEIRKYDNVVDVLKFIEKTSDVIFTVRNNQIEVRR